MNQKMTNAEIIRYYADSLLDDCLEHSMLDIKNHVEKRVEVHSDIFPYVQKDENTNAYFTDSMYYSALRELVAKNEMVKLIRRGVYQKQEGNSYNDTLPNALADTYTKCIKMIGDVLNQVDVVKATKETFSILIQTQQAISDLESRRIDLLSNTEQEDETNG